jgi:hypothetical protein
MSDSPGLHDPAVALCWSLGLPTRASAKRSVYLKASAPIIPADPDEDSRELLLIRAALKRTADAARGPMTTLADVRKCEGLKEPSDG